MKKNLTKVIMLALTLCMMIAMFAVVASAAEYVDVVALENTTVTYNGKVQKPTIVSYVDGNYAPIALNDENVEISIIDGEDVSFKNVGVYGIAVKFGGKTYNLRYEIKQADNKIGAHAVPVKEFVYSGEAVPANKLPWVKDSFGVKATATFYYADDYADDPASATPVEVKNAGVYTVVFSVEETKNVKGATKTVESVITVLPKEIEVDAALSKTYGEADPKVEMPAGALFGDDVVEIVYDRVDNENVDVYDITLRLVGADAANYKVVPAGEATLTINKFAVTVIVGEHTITYGDELVLNSYSFKDGVGFFAKDDIEVVLSPIDLAAQVGTYYLEAEVVGAAAANYEVDYDYENAILVLVPRVLTADDFVLDNNTFVYNGQLQLPNVLLVDGALGAFGDAECGLEVIGSARKYGGTYYVTVVALKTENYVLADDVRLEYTILAEGEKNSNDAVVEFLAGVVNAGEIVGGVVEVVAPVVNTIGKVIVDGIKNGVTALFNDFFGRVFG